MFFQPILTDASLIITNYFCNFDFNLMNYVTMVKDSKKQNLTTEMLNTCLGKLQGIQMHVHN